MPEENYFRSLHAKDMSGKTKEKNGLSYLPWNSAWAAIKEDYPDATYLVHEQIIDDYGNTRPWFTDGKYGWTKVSVTVNGITHTITLPIMDLRNKAIPEDQIDSTSANKSMMRCLVKACAMHGLGMYVFQGEDLPEELVRQNELLNACIDLVKKKCALSDNAKKKVAEICNELAADYSGDYRLITDNDVLEELHKRLLAIRK